MSDVLRAADALADAVESDKEGNYGEVSYATDEAIATYRAARDATPTAELSGLPEVLASVDDVRAVCLARGMVNIVAGHTWGDDHTSVTVGPEARDAGVLTVVSIRLHQQPWTRAIALVPSGAPAAVLVAAIEAARGGAR